MALSVKAGHIQTVLRLLIQTPGATRPQLCAQSGLAPSAMHGIITRLLERKVISLCGPGASNGGRRAETYRLRPGLGVIGAVSIRLTALTCGLFDTDLKPLAQSSRAVSIHSLGPESYTALAAGMMDKLMEQLGKGKEDCFGVGVTLPGPVRFPDGTVQQVCGAPLWQGFPLAGRLRQALGVPVAADKDVYAGIVYLRLSGKLTHPECAAYLSICEGIGASLMMDGKPFRGGHSLSGEIGHLTVRKDGIPCRCGNTGCLELYCSDIGLVRQYNAQSGSSCQDVEEVLRHLAQGNAAAAKVVAQAISYLVDTTASIIMAYDPKELFIYCRWLSCQKALYFKMLDVLYAKSIFTQRHQVDIRLLDPEPIYLPAAAAMVLDSLMLDPQGRLMRRVMEGNAPN